ncbi:ATPase associated with various cellular activities, AAA_5 [Bathymodiolus thermophilus thioautotrophic gill symbiont]|uniref:McrB family protein n=1 Tax=Bathymodiolus thermophilus thioautotrophic gill symbiont TaxID=2360 RepID=UPI0010B73987|nr:AAA family ATPase [Bathymodiolus thermophilus thioautotrophic gill symbiont]SHA08012.1 ATPase associated with various cellular activities, AAA_5 [Bathymodiolus thermophilus thioautotrophic gill symbiont]
MKKDNTENDIFAWVEWFSELATIIDTQNQTILAEKINQIIENKEPIIERKAYDPFSFFYLWAQKNRAKQRVNFFNKTHEVFNMTKPLLNFNGDNCWLFPMPPFARDALYCKSKEKYNPEQPEKKYNPELLWRFFHKIMTIKNIDELESKATDDEFTNEFQAVLKLLNVGVSKLTQTLFLINPNIFFPIDEVLRSIAKELLDNPIVNTKKSIEQLTIDGVKPIVNKLEDSDANAKKNIKQLQKNIKQNGFSEYLKIMQKIRALFPDKKLYEINCHLWGSKKDMEQEFKQWLRMQTTQKGSLFSEAQVKNLCKDLRKTIPSWDNVSDGNLFGIVDTKVINKLYVRCSSGGDLKQLCKDTGNNSPSNALKRYEEFLSKKSSNQGSKKMSNELKEKIKLLKYKKQIILQGSPGTGKTRLAKEIAYCLITGDTLSDNDNERQVQLKILMQSNQKSINKTDAIFEKYLKKLLVIPTINGSSSFTITEIIPKYINIELTEGGKSYKVTKNKILDRINRKDLKTSNGLSSYEVGIAKYIFDAQNPPLNPKTIDMPGLKDLTANLESNKTATPENMPLNLEQYKLIQFHPAYTYEDFVRGIVAETNDNGNISYEVKNKILVEMAENAINNPNSSFVLIIDEINRANLSSVLGELIYALEYRGEAVESMYEYEGSREITLPENLYIIGTMNTADRSVGHIDYAIRRRFAFVDVNTDESVILGDANKLLFKQVKALFDNLSDEFDKNDVMIGHSYFLREDLALALEYEIKPILQEYRKDGVLTCRQKDIEDLEC